MMLEHARINIDDLRLLGAQFKQAREALGLKRHTLARQAGYKNLNKGMRRITALENGKAPLADETVLKRFAQALDLDLDALCEQILERVAQRHKGELKRQIPWLGKLLAEAREAKGWSIEQVIARVIEQAELPFSGNSAHRLKELESGKERFPRLAVLDAFAEALDIPLEDARAAYHRECEFYDHLDAKPTLIVRVMPAIYIPQKYPEHLDTAQLLRFAMESSAQIGRKLCVSLPQGRAVYIEPDGHRFESRRGPQMSIR